MRGEVGMVGKRGFEKRSRMTGLDSLVGHAVEIQTGTGIPIRGELCGVGRDGWLTVERHNGKGVVLVSADQIKVVLDEELAARRERFGVVADPAGAGQDKATPVGTGQIKATPAGVGQDQGGDP
jgi:hypothetical protein